MNFYKSFWKLSKISLAKNWNESKHNLNFIGIIYRRERGESYTHLRSQLIAHSLNGTMSSGVWTSLKKLFVKLNFCQIQLDIFSSLSNLFDIPIHIDRHTHEVIFELWLDMNLKKKFKLVEVIGIIWRRHEDVISVLVLIFWVYRKKCQTF